MIYNCGIPGHTNLFLIVRVYHYVATHVLNKNSIIQVRSPNVVKLTFHTTCTALAPSVSKFFPLSEVPISKRDAIEESHCLIQ